jgi:hypothetical protein
MNSLPEQILRGRVQYGMRRILAAACAVVMLGALLLIQQTGSRHRESSKPLLPAGVRAEPYTVTVRVTRIAENQQATDGGLETLALPRAP